MENRESISPEVIRESRKKEIVDEIVKDWEAKNGSMYQPLTRAEIEWKNNLGIQVKPNETRMTDRATDFYFDPMGGGQNAVTTRAEQELLKRYPEYSEDEAREIENEVLNPLAKADVDSVQNFDQLMEIIDRSDGVKGTQEDFYNKEGKDKLKMIINMVRNKESYDGTEIDIQYVTRTAGLRDKVHELLQAKDESFKNDDETQPIVPVPPERIIPLDSPLRLKTTPENVEAEVQSENPQEEINNEENNLELIDDVNKNGRLLVHTVLTEKLAQERTSGRAGGQNIFDEKFSSSDPNNNLFRDFDFTNMNLQSSVFHNMNNVLEKNEISAGITLEPVIINEPEFEVEKIQTGFFRRRTEEKRVFKGYKKVHFKMEDFNDEVKGFEGESAYKILYRVLGTDKHPFIDPTSKRTGGIFVASIILPESLAREAFESIKSDPRNINLFLKKLDPKLMSEMEEYIPEYDRVLIVSEDDANETVTINQNGVVTAVNPKYIQSV